MVGEHKKSVILDHARHAASVVRDLLDMAREVAEWRKERDAFVAMHQIEEKQREQRELR
jgi:hypothetical protein